MENNIRPKAPQRLAEESRHIIQSLKAKADRRRSVSEKFADWLTSRSGSIGFLALNALWFLAWIAINTGLVPGIAPFDPFPFGLLTMVVSLEAIMLAIVVLISQDRAVKVDDLREEIDLQVDIITERELTKLMEMVAMLLEKNDIDVSGDAILQEMLRPTDTGKIERALEKQIGD